MIEVTAKLFNHEGTVSTWGLFWILCTSFINYILRTFLTFFLNIVNFMILR